MANRDEREKSLKDALEALKEAQQVEVAALSRENELGPKINFLAAVDPLTEIQERFLQLSARNIDQLPT